MGFSGACSPDQHGVAFMVQKIATGEIADQLAGRADCVHAIHLPYNCGIGVTIQMEDEDAHILSVNEGGPADKAGVRAAHRGIDLAPMVLIIGILFIQRLILVDLVRAIA